MTSRIIAHVDMNAFFASLEANEHPEWKGEPIIVCVFSGRSPESGVVSSASYDARKQGVHAGMPIVQAKSLLPQAHFVRVRHELYNEVSESIFTRLYSFSDAVEIASIDEAYAELTQKCSTFEIAEKKLRTLQQDVKRDLNLGCSIGLASNKLVAKIASDYQKPNGFTIILRERQQSFLDPLPVNGLVGVGPKTSEELTHMGIRTIFDLRLQRLSELVSRFGSARGQWLYASSRGIDESPLRPERERKQHSRMWTLVKDASSWDEIAPLARSRAEELWNDTAGKGLFFTQIGVIGVTSSHLQQSKSKTFTVPFVAREQFYQELGNLFQLLMEDPSVLWRRMGIRVSGFASPPKQKRLSDF